MTVSLTYERLYRRIETAGGDRLTLKRVRRSIRASATLNVGERADLLEWARYTPGCIPPEVEIEPLTAQN